MGDLSGPRRGHRCVGAALGVAAAFLMWTALGCGGRSVEIVASGSPDPARAPQAPVTGAFIAYGSSAGVFTLGNAYFARKLHLHDAGAGITTTSLVLRAGQVELLSGVSAEFSIALAGRDLIGYGGDLRYVDHELGAGPSGSQSLRLLFEDAHRGPTESGTLPAASVRVEVIYEVYPDVPLMRKRLSVVNVGDGPLRIGGAVTELLRLRGLERVGRWSSTRGLVWLTSPATVGGDSGLVAVETAPPGGGRVSIALVNGAPGPLKSAAVAGRSVSVGTASEGGLWLHPDDSAELGSVWTWIEAGTSPEVVARVFETFDEEHGSGSAADGLPILVAVADGGLAQAVTALPQRSLVCVPYAWQAEWDRSGSGYDELLRARDVVRKAGHAFGLVVPVAWLPADGALAENKAWCVDDSEGVPAAAVWRGAVGVQASLASGYGDLALESLRGISESLDLAALLLDGPLLGEGSPSDGESVSSHDGAWEVLAGLVHLIEQLRVDRPGMSIGVSGSAYGLTDGYDLTMARLGFLWRVRRLGGTLPESAGGLWRDAVEVHPQVADQVRGSD